MIFPAFGKILVLVNAFFPIQILVKKALKNCVFQLLARSWFWGMFFSIQIQTKSIEKLIFSAFGKILVLANAFFYSNCNEKGIEKLILSAFGKILVLVNAFFYSNSKQKRIEKLIFSSFWQDFGFGECFLLFKL